LTNLRGKKEKTVVLIRVMIQKKARPDQRVSEIFPRRKRSWARFNRTRRNATARGGESSGVVSRQRTKKSGHCKEKGKRAGTPHPSSGRERMVEKRGDIQRMRAKVEK